MRQSLFAIVLSVSTFSAAAPAAPPADRIQIPPELTDPKVADQLEKMTQAMSKAFLDLPVGEIEAAAEGRPATAAERRRTIRDVARTTDPDIERKIAESGPRMRAAMKAFSDALPAMTKALSEAAEAVERASANVPQPGYPNIRP